MTRKTGMSADRRGEFQGRWAILLGAVIGISVSLPSLTFSYGVFLSAFETNFGWSRADLSVVMSILGICVFVGAVPTGLLADRFGPRIVASTSLCLYALSLLVMPLIIRDVTTLWVGYGIVGLLGTGTLPAVMLKSVIATFDRQRGLAVGIAMSGMGIGAASMPFLASRVIDHWGLWAGYFGVGAVTFAGAIIVAICLPAGSGTKTAGSAGDLHEALPGMILAEAVKTSEFWLMSAISVFCILGISGISAHLVPLMRDHGISLSSAANLASALGLASIAGRLLTGLLLDRINGPSTGFFVVGLGAVGAAILIIFGADAGIISAIFIGFALGAEVDLIAYFTSRYFGMRAHGTIFGWNYGMIALGGAAGPVITGLMYDSFGSYNKALIVMVSSLTLSSVLCLILGPYRFNTTSDRTNSPQARADRHSEDGEPNMVAFRDPERSVLTAREQRKREKPPFAGRQS